ncbi:MAG: putative phosphate transport protein (TIGR00153 family) [Porticoccus sp.]|jgi:predicted phosphate transport protein (TIGR00153 family)
MVFSKSIFKLFGKSPISPLQAHMTVVVACAEKLQNFLAATIANDWQLASDMFDAISKNEDKADEMKRKLRLQLPKSLFMPLDRGDLLDLLSLQDRIANRSKDIAGLMLGRKMSIPEPLHQKITDLLSSSIDVARQALKAINELDELLEVGFSGNEVDLVEKMIGELDLLEDKTDQLEQEIRHQLLELEQELPPIDMMFLYQVIDMIGELADLAEGVGGRLQLLLAR